MSDSAASSSTPTAKKIDELYDLVGDIETAMLTTRRPDGSLVCRPMATQKRADGADLWFVTNKDTHKVDELEADPNVCLGYLNGRTMEWVSVSGTATLSQDRAKIKELYMPDWKAWFGDEGGERDGGPDDPRLLLIGIDAKSVHYMKAKHTMPVALFEIAKGMVTGDQPDLGREEQLSGSDLS